MNGGKLRGAREDGQVPNRPLVRMRAACQGEAMDWLPVAATDGEHRYTLSFGVTALAVAGAAACVVVAALLSLQRTAEAAPHDGEEPRGYGPVVLAGLALVVTVVAGCGGGRGSVSVGSVFSGTRTLDAAAVAVAGLAAVAFALRTRSMAALGKLMPAWLVAQGGLLHQRALNQPLPRFLSLGVQTVQVGREVHLAPKLDYSDIYQVDEVSLAPRERGEHEVVARASGEVIRAERTLRYTAVEERGDPSLPLRAGNQWLLRSADERAELTISVGAPKVLDGLRWYEVEVHGEGRDDKGNKIFWPSWPHRVYEADGRILDDKGEPLVVSGDALPGGRRSCTLEGKLTCQCAEAGPVRCHWRETHTEGMGEFFLAVTAKLVTLGQADTSVLESKIKTVVVAEIDLELVQPKPPAR
jgi:hypothetical protein